MERHLYRFGKRKETTSDGRVFSVPVVTCECGWEEDVATIPAISDGLAAHIKGMRHQISEAYDRIEILEKGQQ